MIFYVLSHYLMIVADEHQNINGNKRFCQICLKRNVYIVEDESHVFLECHAYDVIKEIH